jgi:F420-non-reducing hydrogenase iron-sulfur subunit
LDTLNCRATLYLFYCSNSFTADELDDIINRPGSGIHRLISVPCSGKADVLYLLKAFETGADGIVILTCPRNECRYLEGNLRAPRRAAKVDSILSESGMEGGRIIVLSPAAGDLEGTRNAIAEFSAKIGNMSTRGACESCK